MITDPFYVVYHMEQRADTFQVFDGKGGLVDFHQVIGDGMIQEVDIFLYRIHFLYVFLIQRNQGIHGPVQVFAGQAGHPFDFLDYFHHCRSRVKYHLVPYVFKLEAVTVAHLFVISRHKNISHLYKQPGEWEQQNYLQNLNDSMGVRHTSAGIAS